MPTIDDHDRAILAERMTTLDADTGPRVGDYVRFADEVLRRISHIWPGDDDDAPRLLQTSDGGSYYLGNGYVSMSGSLHPTVPEDTLTRTDETREGSVWFFHHDWWQAHNGVHFTVPFRVYACNRPAPR